MSGLFDRLNKTQKSAASLALMAEAAHLLNSSIEYEEVLNNVLKLLTQAVNAEGAMVYRYDESCQELRGRFFFGDNAPKRLVFKKGQGFVGWVAEHHKPIISNDPVNDDRYCEFDKTESFDMKTILCYPLKLRGKFFGVIEALNARGGLFDQTDLDTFEILSDQIALAIHNARLYRLARRQALETETLFKVNHDIMSSLHLDEVLYNILEALANIVDFDAGGVFLIDEESSDVESITSIGYDKLLAPDLRLKIGQGIVGDVATKGTAEIINDVSEDKRYINSRPETKSEIVIPIKLEDKMVGILNLESDEQNIFTNKDRDILTTFASQAALAIERARMHKFMLDQKKLEAQLSIARTIQKTFLPKAVPQMKDFDIWGMNIPSGEVGGDYYDFISIVDNQIGIAIADVSGKGIPAALIMASYRASLIAEIRNNYAIRTICRKVNNLLCESLEPENFVTSIYGVLDTKNSIFTFSNCGHNPGLLLRSNDSVEELMEGGIILGIRPDSRYEERPIYINSGDILCLFTDGVTEAEDKTGDQFETERMLDILKNNRELPARKIGEKMINSVKAFAHRDFTMDDLTLIIIKRN
ncbi:MAG: SpoIIE family protein phosphatase [candidate division Zixibacteria bacterium]|nr:SpoIIE family protein phosphatase [candidate division Zixibacteria bacterium]